MTLSRVLGVLSLFCVVALAVVHLRAEEARTARRIQQMQIEMVETRRELWSVQLAIAQRKAPRRIAREVDEQALEVAGPAEAQPETDDADRWAGAR